MYLCGQTRNLMRKKLPIGIQTFAKIHDPKDNWIYIDKTEIAYELITTGQLYFLSRPRRFGKSLFLDTLANIFKGNKELFEGLAIYDKWDWEETHPVIKISFGSGSYQEEVLIDLEFERIFNENNESLGLTVEYKSIEHSRKSFDTLIKSAFKKFNKKVVVLIDEYDKLILDNIANEDKSLTKKARSILRNFYSALKDNEDKLQFVFLTGVSKFSKLNLFSGLNNIEDITLDKKYATITGYTHEDVKSHFAEYIGDTDMELVRQWYNGYNYFGEPIYNPFDILLFFSKENEFHNYWWETGNPAFLIDTLKKGNHFLPDIENCVVSRETLNSFDIEYIDIVALLWQTGYLTFDRKVKRGVQTAYKMKVPNLEILSSLNTLFGEFLTGYKREYLNSKFHIYDLIEAKDIDGLKDELYSFFAAIPYENYVRNNIASYEGYYASVLFALLSSVGFASKTEDSTNLGRIDMTLLTDDAIFIVEFKVDMPEESALKQIKAKRYYEKYLSEDKPIYLIGIHFSSEEKNISSMEWEKFSVERGQ